MDYQIKEYAFDEAQVTVWSSDDLEAEEEFIGVPGSPTIVSGLEQVEVRERKKEMLTGSVDEIAARIVELIQESL
jgi:alkanesulfonate monooxygenase SsuD/methylene tetrahydromethanopterin reductase-like flavin-dependent oxidoreductase (luciferase family)